MEFVIGLEFDRCSVPTNFTFSFPSFPFVLFLLLTIRLDLFFFISIYFLLSSNSLFFFNNNNSHPFLFLTFTILRVFRERKGRKIKRERNRKEKAFAFETLDFVIFDFFWISFNGGWF